MKTVLVLLLLSAVGAEKKEKVFEMGEKLIGRSIYVESLKVRGAWMAKVDESDDHLGKELKSLRFKGSLEEKIYFQEWARFKVIDCGQGTVCVLSDYKESRFWYYSNDVVQVLTTKVSYHPQSDDAFKFRIQCTNEKFERCRIKVESFMLYFTFFGNKNDIPNSLIGPWALDQLPENQHFRILAPVGTTELRDILEPIVNDAPTEITRSVTHSVGVESTTESSFQLTAGLSASISAGFGGFEATVEASIETSMSKAMSATNSNSVEETVTYTIPKYSKYEIKQTVGEYGPFRVKTGTIVVLCTDLKTKKPCIETRDEKKKKKKVKA